jgi:hypothetical protein
MLALTKTLVDFGVSVRSANALAERAMLGYPTPVPDRRKRECFHERSVKAWAEHRLHVFRDAVADGGWDLEAVYKKNRPEHRASAFISVDVETVLREAFARALAAGSS